MLTILLFAVYGKHPELVMQLLKKIPLHFLLEKGQLGKSIAHDFAAEGMLKGMEYLASNSWTKALLTDKDNRGCTPFITAVLNNQKTIVNYLIDKQYDSFASEMHAAAFWGDLEKIKILIKNSKNERDTFNIDPPGYAIASGKIETLEYLIQNYFSPQKESYPNLFITALELQHDKMAKLLLTKAGRIDFIKKIPQLVEILANSTTAIEMLNKLSIEQFILPQYKFDAYSCFIASAIIKNSPEIFTYFIKKLFTEEIHLSFLKTINYICTLLSEHRRFQFTTILAKELFTKTPAVVAQCCCHFIEKNDGISLDIFLKTFKDFSKKSIYKLARCNIHYYLFYHTLKSQKLDLLIILRRYFTDNFFQENTNFFESPNDFLYFSEIYLPKKNNDSILYSLEHDTFVEAIRYTMSRPEDPESYYLIASQNLRAVVSCH